MNTLRTLVFSMVSVLPIACLAQSPEMTPLFKEEKPLTVKLQVSLKKIKKETNDTTFIASTLYFKDSEKVNWDSIPIRIRARGKFRRDNCYFVPMRIKIKKGDAKGTVFEGNKSLKLVLPCNTAKTANSLIVKEYICYQLYERVTPYNFNTRFLNITLEEGEKKKTTHQLLGFFIEDDDIVADRFHGKEIDSTNLHPLALHDTTSVRHDLFEYWISNTDWSSTFYHNVKIIQNAKGSNIPLPYDFDMSGFVNAPYAKGTPELGTTDSQTRVYRGFCRSEALVQHVRQEYIALEPKLNEIIAQYQSQLDEKDFTATKRFSDEFFTVLKSDQKFKQNILQKCRTK